MNAALCVFHQRFSTTTWPEWRLAQPFRYLAHNGEINTIQGNRNWALARSYKFSTPLIPNMDDIRPLVSLTGSDSLSLDNMLEALLAGGKADEALKTIERRLPALRRVDLPPALLLRARAQMMLAAAARGAAKRTLLIRAGLNFMRAAAAFPTAPEAPAALLGAAQMHVKLAPPNRAAARAACAAVIRRYEGPAAGKARKMLMTLQKKDE